MIGSDIARSTLGFAELGPGPKITLLGTVSGSYRLPLFTSVTNLMFAGDLKSLRLRVRYTNAYLILWFIPAMKITQTLRVQLTSIKT